MRLKKNIQLIDFISEVKKCKGNVYFETTQGDCLVLNSVLSQYIFCAMSAQPELFLSGTVRFDDPKDVAILKNYLEDVNGY